MYAVPTLDSEIGDNKASCSLYASYLLKEVENDHFFNNTSNTISLEDGVDLIDSNSRKGLGKNDAKWFAPLYSFSEDECKHVCELLFNKSYSDYDELLENEKLIYNNYFKKIGVEMQNTMAKNFGKEDIGIVDGSNLFYLGVVENRRKYKVSDEEVKQGLVKEGEFKKGFNTHIHIIQSRLANNGKYSKISPMAKAKTSFKNNLGGITGFNRLTFAKNCEVKFDQLTLYNRENIEKLESKLDNPRSMNKYSGTTYIFSDVSNEKFNNIVRGKRIYFSEKFIKYSVNSFSINDYLNYLLSINKIKYNAKSQSYFFNDKEIKISNKTNCSVGNSQNKDLFYLMYIIEKLNYNQAVAKINYLKEINKLLFLEKKKKQNLKYEIIEVKNEIDRSYLKNNLKKSDIIISNLPNDVVQLKLKNKKTNRFFFSLAFKNLDGSYTLFNDKYQSTQNNNSDNFIFRKGNNDRFKIFENVNDYLRFINLNSNIDDDSIIILNGNHNLNTVSKFINESDFSKGKCYLKSNNFNFIASFSNIDNSNLENVSNDFEKYSKKNRVEVMKQNSLDYIAAFYRKK